MLALLTTLIPLLPKLAAAGFDVYQLYDRARTIIAENRKPTEPEWDELERQIERDQATIRDTSRDV